MSEKPPLEAAPVLTRERLPIQLRSHDTYNLVTGTSALQYEWWRVTRDNRGDLDVDADDDMYVDWEVVVQHIDPESDGEAVGDPVTLDHQKIVDGIWEMVCDPHEKSEEWRLMWLKYLIEPESVDSDIDANDADTLLQSIVIGSVLYG
jgi:hypothetical protein